jgi:hypothetical protein
MKIFLTIFFCVALLFSAIAQTNNPLLKNPRISSIDTLEVVAFRKLLHFIADETQPQKRSDINIDSLKRLSESHFLYANSHTYFNTYDQDNTSYDNFLPTVYHKEGLEGSPFLLTAYVPGLVVNQIDSVIDKTNYLYNYDKVTGNLLLKRDNELPIAVNKEQVKYFCIKEEKGGYIFERVSLISSNEYFQVLYKGPKYSFFKLIKSNFIPSSKTTNGYSTTGNNYDEYKDYYIYYMVDHVKDEFAVLELSKKSIRKALSSENGAVEQYFKDHKWTEIDEPYVEHLFEKLNQ